MRRRFFVLVILWLALLRPALATTQLIADGGFNAPGYTPPWYFGGNNGGTAGIQFNAGYVSMGNAVGASEWVYQAITFPTNLIGATLSLDNAIVSSDPNSDDQFSVWLCENNSSLTFIQQLGTTVTGGPNVNTGLEFGSTNFITYAGSNLLSSYAGQTVNLLFYVTTDPTYGNLTSFDFTGVSVVAGTTADIPSNDDFTNATVIPSSGTTNVITTTYASRENGEPDHAGNPGGHSLWWTWTAPEVGVVNISVTDSDFTSLLAVYTGSTISNLTVVTNYDGIRNGAGASVVTFPVSPGTQYYIAVDGYNGQSGTALFTYKFTVDKTPPQVVIKSPHSGTDVTTSTVLVDGTASDNVAVAAVYYQLANANGSNAWQLATGTNSWSATVTNLIPGPNTVRVEAYDTSTNVSKVEACVINYIVPAPLMLNKIGEGTVSGATNGQLLHVGYPYTLTAVATAGFHFAGWTGDMTTNTAALHFVMASNLNFTATFADIEKPTLSITEPVVRAKLSNSVLNVMGKAKDNVGVAAVWYQLNSGAWSSVVNTSNAFTNWNVSVNLVPGTNAIKAYATDAAGNISLTNSVSFIYILSAPIVVQISGQGTIKPNYNNAMLAISNSYTMTATADKGSVFSNWVSSAGAVLTNGPTLKFTMQSNLDFTANFVPNPFAAVAGTYDGLFYDTNGVAPASSGFFSAVVENTGSFTAKFQRGAKSYSASGQFSLTGGWSDSALKTWDNTAITLQLDMTGGNDLEGGLTNSAWVAELSSSREVFSRTNLAPQAGHYTLVLPGSQLPPQPGGNGFGTVSVNTSGLVTFSGTLGDGTKVTQSATESGQGQWPLYISLDSGNGMLLGWLTFTNEPDRDIDGFLNWFKPAQTAKTYYQAGFTNTSLEALGSAFVLPTGAPVLNLTDGYVLLTGGGLSQSISNSLSLGAKNVVTGGDKLHLTFTTTSTSAGLFQGTTTNAAGATVTFNGVVFQKQTNGFGLFLNAAQEQSGSVYLAPQ